MKNTRATRGYKNATTLRRLGSTEMKKKPKTFHKSKFYKYTRRWEAFIKWRKAWAGYLHKDQSNQKTKPSIKKANNEFLQALR